MDAGPTPSKSVSDPPSSSRADPPVRRQPDPAAPETLYNYSRAPDSFGKPRRFWGDGRACSARFGLFCISATKFLDPVGHGGGFGFGPLQFEDLHPVPFAKYLAQTAIGIIQTLEER